METTTDEEGWVTDPVALEVVVALRAMKVGDLVKLDLSKVSYSIPEEFHMVEGQVVGVARGCATDVCYPGVFWRDDGVTWTWRVGQEQVAAWRPKPH